MMRILRIAGLTFALAALAGPLLRLATWPPSRFEDATSTEMASFVYHLVLYLWPTLYLAAGQATIEEFLTPGVLYPIAANVQLFAPLGLAVGAAAGRRGIVLLLYIAVCAVLVLFGVWRSGYSLAYLQWLPLAVAMVLYAIPFWLVTRAAARTGIQS